ncbi:putative ribonuclease H-like domain-containing protein [Tanacetum coccineum]
MRINLTILEKMKDIDVMLDTLVENSEEVEKVKEELDRKYKELEESKPILEVLENYMTYRKKLDEVLMGRARLSIDDYGEEAKMRIMEHGLPKKMCDPGNFVLLVKVNGTVEISALTDTGASVSVLPYCLFKNLGLGDPKPYSSNLTMADNTQPKAMGEVKNVRIQIGHQAYLVDFLILDIPVDKEIPLLLGRPFLRTCRAVIDMRHGTLCIDDGVIRHTYFHKPRAKAYLDNFAQEEEEDDWLSCFEVGRDEDGNLKYGPVAPSFLDIEDDMERALAMEAYFNPFKNIIVFKKLIDFLGSLPVQLKNTDWGNQGRFNFRRTSLTGFPAQSIRSSNAIALDSPYLLVLITGTSQSRQHVDTSLIRLESRKSPTAELFDDDSGRISIHHCEY